jgi:hypothetical protein
VGLLITMLKESDTMFFFFWWHIDTLLVYWHRVLLFRKISVAYKVGFPPLDQNFSCTRVKNRTYIPLELIYYLFLLLNFIITIIFTLFFPTAKYYSIFIELFIPIVRFDLKWDNKILQQLAFSQKISVTTIHV